MCLCVCRPCSLAGVAVGGLVAAAEETVVAAAQALGPALRGVYFSSLPLLRDRSDPLVTSSPTATGREDAADLSQSPSLEELREGLRELPAEDGDNDHEDPALLEAFIGGGERKKRRPPAWLDSASVVSDSVSTASLAKRPRGASRDPLSLSAGGTLDEALLAGVDFDALTSSAPGTLIAPLHSQLDR